MSSLWEQRAGRNEALFREVNRNITDLQERYSEQPEQPLLLVCECANDHCAERFNVEADVYEQVREHPRRFLVVPGHEHPELERVVERHSDYLIVEKTGVAGEVAEHADRPR